MYCSTVLCFFRNPKPERGNRPPDARIKKINSNPTKPPWSWRSNKSLAYLKSEEPASTSFLTESMSRHSRAASAALFFDGLSIGDAVWVSDEREAWFEGEVQSVGAAEGTVGGAAMITVRGSCGSPFANKEFQVKRTTVTGALHTASVGAGIISKKKRVAPRNVLPRSTRLLGKEGVSNMVRFHFSRSVLPDSSASAPLGRPSSAHKCRVVSTFHVML